MHDSDLYWDPIPNPYLNMLNAIRLILIEVNKEYSIQKDIKASCNTMRPCGHLLSGSEKHSMTLWLLMRNVEIVPF
jgi:hypothetical protein